MVTPAALVNQARDVYAQAREHKRASTHHRHEAQRAMQEFAELQQRLAEFGITITLTEGGVDVSSWPERRENS